MSSAPTIYDLVPYECAPISATAPEHLSLTSRLEGGPAPPVDAFRMLEIGCGDGSNLLPLAFYHPRATFVGIDASRVQIERGRAAAEELGLSNLRLEATDIRALGDLGAPFEYIVSHGVFSWVPDDARRSILACLRDRLADGGLGYVSYNIHPGWKIRGTVRDVLLEAVRGVDDPRERARQAKQVAADLRGFIRGIDRPYPTILTQELGFVIDSTPNYVLHEYLSEENTPIYFREFLAMAREHGLDYIADALHRDPESQVPDGLRAYAAARGLSDLEVQQTVDVLFNRQFRASLVCRSGTPRGPRAGPEIARGLHVAACLTGASGAVRLEPDTLETFRGGDDTEITATCPLLKASLFALREIWPASLAFSELVARASELLRERGVQSAADEAQIERLAKGVLMLHRQGQAELRPAKLPLRVAPSGRPGLTRLARYELRQRPQLTTPAHIGVALDEFERRLSTYLDGTREIDTLVLTLLREVAAGDPQVKLDGAALSDPVVLEPLVRALVERGLVKLAAWGLLAPPAV